MVKPTGSQLIAKLTRKYTKPWADPEGGGGQGVRTPPLKSQKYTVSKQYWSGSTEKLQSYQASIQCWAVIGPLVKCHLNGISLAG